MELSVASTFTFPLNALEPSAHLKLPLPKDFLGNGLITNKREYVENVFQIVIPACQFLPRLSQTLFVSTVVHFSAVPSSIPRLLHFHSFTYSSHLLCVFIVSSALFDYVQLLFSLPANAITGCWKSVYVWVNLGNCLCMHRVSMHAYPFNLHLCVHLSGHHPPFFPSSVYLHFKVAVWASDDA